MAKTYNQIIYETEIAAELKALCIVYEYVGYERQMSLVFMCPPLPTSRHHRSNDD